MLHQLLLSLICLIASSIYPAAAASASATAQPAASSAAADVKTFAASSEAHSKAGTVVVPTYPEWEDELDRKMNLSSHGKFGNIRSVKNSNTPWVIYCTTQSEKKVAAAVLQQEFADAVDQQAHYARVWSEQTGHDQQIDNRCALYRESYFLASTYRAWIAYRRRDGVTEDELKSFALSLADQLSVLSEKMQNTVCAAAIAAQLAEQTPAGPELSWLLQGRKQRRTELLPEILWPNRTIQALVQLISDYVEPDRFVSMRAFKPLIDTGTQMFLKHTDSLDGLSEMCGASEYLSVITAQHNILPAGRSLVIPPDCFRGLGRVTTVVLNNQNITEFPTQVFAHCPNLVHLNLRGNKISSLPADFEELWKKSKVLHVFLNGNPLAAETQERIKKLYDESSRYIYFDEAPQVPPSPAA